MQATALVMISLLGWSVIAQVASSQESCPAGFDYAEASSTCLKPILEAMTWDEAKNRCRVQAPGAQLFEGYADYGYDTALKIIDYVETFHPTEYIDKCGTHFWTSGKRVTDDCSSEFLWHNNCTIKENDWLWRQPDCSNGEEHCLAFKYYRNVRGLDDVKCSTLMCAICEWRPFPYFCRAV